MLNRSLLAAYFTTLVSSFISSSLHAQSLFPLLGEPVGRRSIASAVNDSSEVEEISGWASEEIETDRDSFTPATTLAGRKRMIVESAYSFIDNRRVPDTHSYPELLFRYGLTDVSNCDWVLIMKLVAREIRFQPMFRMNSQKKPKSKMRQISATELKLALLGKQTGCHSRHSWSVDSVPSKGM